MTSEREWDWVAHTIREEIAKNKEQAMKQRENAILRRSLPLLNFWWCLEMDLQNMPSEALVKHCIELDINAYIDSDNDFKGVGFFAQELSRDLALAILKLKSSCLQWMVKYRIQAASALEMAERIKQECDLYGKALAIYESENKTVPSCPSSPGGC